MDEFSSMIISRGRGFRQLGPSVLVASRPWVISGLSEWKMKQLRLVIQEGFLIDDGDPARERIRINRNKISDMKKARGKGGKRKGAGFARRGNKGKNKDHPLQQRILMMRFPKIGE